MDHYLCTEIIEWLDSGTVRVESWPMPIRDALFAQTKIGWYNVQYYVMRKNQ